MTEISQHFKPSCPECNSDRYIRVDGLAPSGEEMINIYICHLCNVRFTVE